MKIIPNVAAPSHVQFSRSLTDVPVGEGVDFDVDVLMDELLLYTDVLLGRTTPPVASPYLDLCEVATAYYARAQEIDMMIHNLERQRVVIRGHPLYQFRTGSLRAFIEMSKKLADLGSRRLTQEVLLNDQRYDSGGM